MEAMGRGKPANDEAVRQRIRGVGLRCTAARVAVMHHLETASGPLTHAEVAEALDELGFDRATIYRNLIELTEAKLAARVELGDHVWRFEAKRAGGGHKGDDHPHFVCTTCGEVSCLDDVQVAITRRPAGSGDRKQSVPERAIATVTEVLLKGRCERCE
ncbi:MAG: transcriptional repressor [Planctomycetota bacterium]|nr:transcriptional repressor [Pirellulales bacterium]MDA0254753.1 transcriptional repressor [Planctomycetota bacterium]MDA1201785.1 transcriptional repressor [Planctomycetota bacterium]